jgi:ethanolamine utilization cobalamin adenosyltransferase
MDPPDIRRASHQTWELYGVPFMYPAVQQGPVVAKLNVARAYAREAELALYAAFPAPDERPDLKLALNRLSSAFYIMTTKYVGGHYRGTRRRLGPVKGWKPPKKSEPG